MDADEYKRKYRSAQRGEKSLSLGTTDWMEQESAQLGTLGQPGIFAGQNINYADSTSTGLDFSVQSSGWSGDGTVLRSSTSTPSTAYTLSSALSMK